MEKGQFNQLIENRGIRFMHYRAITCPNLNGLNENSHSPTCPHCTGKNIIYYRPKEIFGFFSGNSNQKQFEFNGYFESTSATVTFPSEYQDGEPADFSIFDRVVAVDYLVQTYEMKEYEVRKDLTQQLRFPIDRVEYLITADDSGIREFSAGVDFNIVDGKIQWVADKSPSYSLATQIGDVYSVRYLTQPSYLVVNLIRELRASQQTGSDNIKRAIRLPQQLVLKREFFQNPSEKTKEA